MTRSREGRRLTHLPEQLALGSGSASLEGVPLCAVGERSLVGVRHIRARGLEFDVLHLLQLLLVHRLGHLDVFGHIGQQ